MCGKEMEWDVRGRRVCLCRDTVLQKLDKARPGRVHTYYVIIHGTRYPLKEALARAAGLRRADFSTTHAFRILTALSFPVGQMS